MPFESIAVRKHLPMARVLNGCLFRDRINHLSNSKIRYCRTLAIADEDDAFSLVRAAANVGKHVSDRCNIVASNGCTMYVSVARNLQL